jgi:hypothetical protein
MKSGGPMPGISIHFSKTSVPAATILGVGKTTGHSVFGGFMPQLYLDFVVLSR